MFLKANYGHSEVVGFKTNVIIVYLSKYNDQFYFSILSRSNSLRQFLVVLCERNELGLLIDLPYQDDHTVMEDEVITLLI